MGADEWSSHPLCCWRLHWRNHLWCWCVKNIIKKKLNNDSHSDVCLVETIICREISEEQESFGEVRSSRPRGIHILWFLHLQKGLNLSILDLQKGGETREVPCGRSGQGLHPRLHGFYSHWSGYFAWSCWSLPSSLGWELKSWLLNDLELNGLYNQLYFCFTWRPFGRAVVFDKS